MVRYPRGAKVFERERWFCILSPGLTTMTATTMIYNSVLVRQILSTIFFSIRVYESIKIVLD